MTELDIIDGLTALGYNGKCLQNAELANALNGGPRSVEFREVVAWLTNELHILRKTDEKVSSDLEDPSEFAMELSAMLKELGCPYQQFIAGPLSGRFESKESRLELLDYLITELMAIKMVLKLRPAEQTDLVIPKFETNTARALEQLCRDLGIEKPPAENVAPKAFFDKIKFKVEEAIRRVKPGVLSEPLLRTQKPLTDEQWRKLEEIHNDLDAEYNLRRQVLLTRLDVTIQSFQWADSAKNKENEIVERFQKKLNELEALKYGGADTNIVALLAARDDLAVIEKTSSANVRKNTATEIQKHVIGSVPDRGGRAHEHAPPPPEMPSWQQQRASGPPGGGRGGGGNFRGNRGGGGPNRGGSGGPNRGGGGGGQWQQQQQQQQQHKPQYQQQQQPYAQRPQFEQISGGAGVGYNQNQNQNQNWMAGSGRVQGTGWNQNSNNDYDRNQGYERNRGGDGQSNYRGRSNYHRGGRR